MKRLMFGLLMLMTCVRAFGQTTPDMASIIKNMGYYNHKLSPDILFAHFDKTIYTNNENVWFTAYMLNGADHDKNAVLSVVLMNDDEHTMVLEKKFVMAKGISFGNLVIPDSLLSGNYTFLLYTNHVINGQPTDVFRQPITIKNTNESSFTAFLDLLDTAHNQTSGDRRVLLLTHNKGTQLAAGATVDYRLGDKQHAVVSGKAITDKAGQYQFNIPVKNINATSNRLKAKITFNKQVQETSLKLPTPAGQPVIKFYPEGGSIVNNVLCNIGWEAKSADGDTYRIKAFLMTGNTILDTIETNGDGIGRFWLKPEKGSSYRVKLLHLGKDTTYNLPAAVNDIASITLLQGVCNDTLKAVIRTDAPGKIYAVLHNYRQTFGIQPLNTTAAGLLLKTSLTGIPKGVVAITLLNEQLQPFAERLFFAHYDRRTIPVLSTDANQYTKRQRVTLKLRLPAIGKDSLSGLVSVACVQAGRQESLKAANIESYLYIGHELNILPGDKTTPGVNADKSKLENILLIKGWRRYKWVDMMQAVPADTVSHYDNMGFDGFTTHNQKKLKEPVEVIVMKNGRFSLINTDQTGAFKLRDSDLYVTDNKKVYLQISGDSFGKYSIDVKDAFANVNNNLAANFSPINYDVTGKMIDLSADLKDFEHATQLREVKVTDKQAAGIQYGATGANACGDYVCRFNILNCPNHQFATDNRAPVEGGMYIVRGTLQRYDGCQVSTVSTKKSEFAGINYAMEFYGPDYSNVNPSTPDYSSTIYWKHLCRITSTHDTELTFYTTDVTGAFKIVVQGIIPGDVVYAEKTIRVAEK